MTESELLNTETATLLDPDYFKKSESSNNLEHLLDFQRSRFAIKRSGQTTARDVVEELLHDARSNDETYQKNTLERIVPRINGF